MQKYNISRFYVSAAHKSSGKTIISIGLCAAFRERRLTVQPFKKGPDYIDPLWLGRASNAHCINLDFNTQSRSQIVTSFYSDSLEVDVAVIEGNKGLHDGVAVDGSDCNAELAALLSTPVILVLDTQGTTRGIAPLLLGYQEFDRRINIAGVILNKIAGPRHEQKLRANIEAHTDIRVIGAVPRDKRLIIEERHLGLVPSSEVRCVESQIDSIKQLIESNVNLDDVLAGTELDEGVEPQAPKADFPRSGPHNPEKPRVEFPKPSTRIGIPRDRAFGFYYVDDLTALRNAGNELVFFDTLEDQCLPKDLDGLFIGGGFPEMYMAELQANEKMRQSVFDFISAGGPVYAECGGLMYLGQSIRWGDRLADMVGALPVSAEMTNKPVGRGYVELEETGRSPWGVMAEDHGPIKAHEFHHSKIELLDETQVFAYRVKRGWGIDGENDGLIFGNVLASYSHLRSITPFNWADQFTRFVRKITSRRQ